MRFRILEETSRRMSTAPNGATLGTLLSQVEKDKESVYKIDIEW